ncbi:hypothetical protein BDZ91DRAFT_745563 [Kalaharituber pfeilii]|nr:hypothetical protein BDZ91DRAFT_745563 [Kalaharituber pfeilii]
MLVNRAIQEERRESKVGAKRQLASLSMQRLPGGERKARERTIMTTGYLTRNFLVVNERWNWRIGRVFIFIFLSFFAWRKY